MNSPALLASVCAVLLSGCTMHPTFMRSYDLRQWEHSFLGGNAALVNHQYETAQRCFEKSLTFAEILDDRQKIAAALDGKASCCAAQNKSAPAVQYYQESIQILRECLKENDSQFVRENLARELSRLGCLYKKNGRIEESSVALKESLNVFSSPPVPDGTNQVSASRDYALALAAMFDIAANSGDVERAIKYGEEYLSPTHPVNATTGSADQIRARYIQLLRKDMREADAEVVDAEQQYLKEVQLAKELKRQKDFTAALDHYLKAVSLAKLTSGKSKMLVDAYEGAADMCDHLSPSSKEMRQYLVVSLDTSERASTGPTEEKDRLLLKLVRFDLLAPLSQIEPEMTRWYEIRRRLYGEQDERTATALVNMACVYDAHNEDEKAKKAAGQAWAIMEKSDGSSEPPNYRLFIGDYFICMGERDKAEILYKQGLPGLNMIRPEALAAVHYRLALCAQLRGDSKGSALQHEAATNQMTQVRSDSKVTRQGAMSLLFLLSDLQRHKQKHACEIVAGYIKELIPNIRSAQERPHLGIIKDSLERLSQGLQIHAQRVCGKSRPLKDLEATH